MSIQPVNQAGTQPSPQSSNYSGLLFFCPAVMAVAFSAFKLTSLQKEKADQPSPATYLRSDTICLDKPSQLNSMGFSRTDTYHPPLDPLSYARLVTQPFNLFSACPRSPAPTAPSKPTYAQIAARLPAKEAPKNEPPKPKLQPASTAETRPAKTHQAKQTPSDKPPQSEWTVVTRGLRISVRPPVSFVHPNRFAVLRPTSPDTVEEPETEVETPNKPLTPRTLKPAKAPNEQNLTNAAKTKRKRHKKAPASSSPEIAVPTKISPPSPEPTPVVTPKITPLHPRAHNVTDVFLGALTGTVNFFRPPAGNVFSASFDPFK